MSYETYGDQLNFAKCMNTDEWFGIVREDEAIGADFNYYMENGEDISAIYAVYPNSAGSLETDVSDYEHYHINFDDSKWKESLIKAMIDFCERRINENL